MPETLRTGAQEPGRWSARRGLVFSFLGFGVGAVVLTSQLADEPQPPRGQDPSLVSPSTSIRTPVEAASAVPLPDVEGLTLDQVEQALAQAGWSTRQRRTVSWEWIADDQAPEGTVISQVPPAGSTSPDGFSRLVISDGGPTVELHELPAPALDLLPNAEDFGSGFPFRVITTPVGDAYKIDALLFGPCAAVEAAYRTARDPAYDSGCYPG